MGGLRPYVQIHVVSAVGPATSSALGGMELVVVVDAYPR